MKSESRRIAVIKPFKAPAKLPEITAADLDNLQPINGDQLLTQVTEFIGRYLQCTDHQRTVLALWVLHTHCLPAAQVTPYLAIQSAEKQSGKTLCLQLLNLLCDHPALTASFTANTLTRRIDGPISTILLDECQATVGTRNRSKGPTLRAILSSGFHCGPGYTDATHERNAFAPKAFAGMGQLPEALADRSIPIILKPLKRVGQPLNGSGAQAPARNQIQRFDLTRAIKEAKPLQEQLLFWAEDNCPDLEEKPAYAAEHFPPGLSSRHQDIIEPLLLLADHIGGTWPSRIREALNAVFLQEAAFNLAQSLQLLADIRDCFAWYRYPARLSSAALVSWMQSRPSRPWDGEGTISARVIAELLRPFDIWPRVQRIEDEDPARGYRLEDFVGPWQTYLAFTVPDQDPPASVPEVTHHGNSRISNNHADCNAVTDSRAVSVAPSQTRVAQPPSTVSEAHNSGAQPPSAASTVAKQSEIAGPTAHDGFACDGVQIANKACPRGELASRRDAASNAVTDSRAVSKSDALADEFRHNLVPEAVGNGFHSTLGA
jgi:Protein of unknown function (DUF3631)